MLIDEVTITVRAGRGGRGAVAFNKNKLALGPTGGSGGVGGSVYLEAAADIGALRRFRYKKEIEAEDGKDGRGQFRDGPHGKNTEVKVPVGTVVHNVTKGTTYELVRIGERLRVAEGGRGGKGNFHFRSSRNTSPKQFQEGMPGEEATLRLELKLLADVGLIGSPNAGKSSLLNVLTEAKSKVGNYPFTTLEPHLGAYYELILADIPGLIEGASRGKGLGTKFLRHIERTGVLFHLVSAESIDPLHEYRMVRKELGEYAGGLLQKKEHVFLSKSDLLNQRDIQNNVELFRKAGISLAPLSVYEETSIRRVRRILDGIIRGKRA